jgi:catechol 2,3-dioxygenase-like lactoylglutathione lyase family enzyme
MNARIDVINLGVSGLREARAFYEDGLGAAVSAEDGALLARLGPHASRLALRRWDAVAEEAGVGPQSSGFRAFTLSYIVESADAVDQILGRVARYGGRVSKPPKNAMWGYSAYVTDPSGYLWKIASSKRRPLRARSASPADERCAVTPNEVPITIGVGNMRRATDFYTEGLRLPIKKSFGTRFVMFSGEGEFSDLGMYKREALAKDAAVKPEGDGFHGFSITHVVDAPAQVDELLDSVTRAGGRVVRQPARVGHDGYSGSFADPDGNIWRVASRN